MSTAEPLVSVIVPSYNHERFVVDALESVAAQTYPRLELVVVDDHSRDASPTLIPRWLESERALRRFERVRWHRNPSNQGAHASINTGIERTSGEYVTVLNSDDLYAPQRIEALVAATSGCGARLAFTGVHTIGDDGARLALPGLSSTIESMCDFALAHPSVSFALMRRNLCVTTGNLFFTAELARALGGFRPLKYCHDWDFALRAALQTEPLLVEAPMYRYRLHAENSFSALQMERFLEPQIVYRTFFSQCRSGHCSNPLAPDPVHWEYFAEAFYEQSHYLKDAWAMSGQALPQYDTLARMIRYNVGIVPA